MSRLTLEGLGGPGRALGAAYAGYVRAVCARPRLAAALLSAACLPALLLSIAFFGHIEAGLQELLPPSAPAARALSKLHALVGGKAHLTIIVRSPDRLANERFVTELTERLRAIQLPEIRSVEGDIKEERAWAIRRAPLLIPQADFDKLVTRFDVAARAEKERHNPFQLDLGEDERPPAVDWKGIERDFDAALTAQDRFPTGYVETADGKLVAAIVWLAGSEVDLAPAEKLLAAVQREADALHPQYPAVQVAFNGEVPNLVEEHAAIVADLSISTVFVVALVGLFISLYFRSVRAVATVVLTLAPGLLFAFALGRLTVGGLNSNTAFLGTIIAGNGINYPLLLLAYYRAEPLSMNMEQALVVAGRQALPGTVGAALAASAAYGGLAASDFRGFSQFGILGGLGMATVWLFTYLAAPILVALLQPPRRQKPSTLVQRSLHAFFSRGRLSSAVAIAFVLLTLAWAGLGVVRALNSGVYEMNMQTLRNQESLEVGSASWDARINEVFGVWLNPVVAVADNPAQREPAATELRRAFAERDAEGIQAVETIEKYVPPLASQRARLRELKRMANMVRRVPEADIPQRLRSDVVGWLAPESLEPIELAEVPERLVSSFRELSGRVDRVVLVFPSIHVNYNDGRNIQRFADVVRSARLPPDVTIGGSFLFMAEILRLVQDQALHVVLVVSALVCVLLLVIFAHQPARAIISLVTMLLAAFASQAVTLALGVKVNLLNFAALPITIGVGADYVVNLFGAMSSLRLDAREACVRMGGAILLCSLTTVIGYLSLVLAKSGALRSFGWAAALGELVAILAVLLVLPVALGSRPTNAAVPPPCETPPVTGHARVSSQSH
jgi:uncharacterized protein